MSINAKMAKIIILCALLLLVIVLFVGFNTYFKRDSRYYVNVFFEKVLTPEDEDSTEFYRELLSGKASQMALDDFGKALEQDYGGLMTEDAYEKAVANRYIPWDVLVKEDDNYKVTVDSYDVKKMSDYKDGSVHYAYLISLKILYASGNNEAVQVSGDVVMTERNGKWFVDAFTRNDDYKGLYEMLLF